MKKKCALKFVEVEVDSFLLNLKDANIYNLIQKDVSNKVKYLYTPTWVNEIGEK